MAELLIKSTDAPTARQGGWKAGDPVVVKPDGHPWGREELNEAKFKIIKLPGTPPEFFDFLNEEVPPQVGRRRWRLDNSLMKAQDLLGLLPDRTI